MTMIETAAPSPTRRFRYRAFRRANLIIGAVIILALVGVAVLSLFWTPVPPAKMQIIHKLQPPFGFGLLGTDQLGHDVLSMLMAGCWNSLSISLSSAAFRTRSSIAKARAAARSSLVSTGVVAAFFGLAR